MIPVSRQCELFELSRSSFYYHPQEEESLNLDLMRMIDEQFTKRPFYGARKMTVHLRASGHPVNRKRVRRLMRVMGIMAIYPKPRLSAGGPNHKIYPYLLKGVTISRPDQAWCADVINPIFDSPMGSYISWSSWTGTAAISCPGSSRSHWRRSFVWTRSIVLF